MIIISLFLVMCSFKEKSFSNGDVFIGKLNGKGKYTSSTGKMMGRGVIIRPSGSKYKSEFSRNYCHGNGTQNWKDGSIYIGNWKKNKMDGRGIMKWANVIFMMVVGQMDLDMAMESACGQMEISMRGVGQKIKWTGEEI
jgi:hypothetical protein